MKKPPESGGFFMAIAHGFNRGKQNFSYQINRFNGFYIKPKSWEMVKTIKESLPIQSHG